MLIVLAGDPAAAPLEARSGEELEAEVVVGNLILFVIPFLNRHVKAIITQRFLCKDTIFFRITRTHAR